MAVFDFISESASLVEADGICTIGDPGFLGELRIFNRRFSATRQDSARITDYEGLPHSMSNTGPEWRLRRHGLEVVEKHARNPPAMNVLDVGAYNSWLTHRLHRSGHQVVALDYFDDADFGLRSKFHYRDHGWTSVQCDLEQPGFLKPAFDLVVFNHCIQFLSDPHKALASYRSLLRPGGKLLILGMHVFLFPYQKKRRMETFAREFHDRHQFEVFLRPTKGYLDKKDAGLLRRSGVRLKWYPACTINNALAHVVPARPVLCYGVLGNHGTVQKPSVSG